MEDRIGKRSFLTRPRSGSTPGKEHTERRDEPGTETSSAAPPAANATNVHESRVFSPKSPVQDEMASPRDLSTFETVRQSTSRNTNNFTANTQATNNVRSVDPRRRTSKPVQNESSDPPPETTSVNGSARVTGMSSTMSHVDNDFMNSLFHLIKLEGQVDRIETRYAESQQLLKAAVEEEKDVKSRFPDHPPLHDQLASSRTKAQRTEASLAQELSSASARRDASRQSFLATHTSYQSTQNQRITILETKVAHLSAANEKLSTDFEESLRRNTEQAKRIDLFESELSSLKLSVSEQANSSKNDFDLTRIHGSLSGDVQNLSNSVRDQKLAIVRLSDVFAPRALVDTVEILSANGVNLKKETEGKITDLEQRMKLAETATTSQPAQPPTTDMSFYINAYEKFKNSTKTRLLAAESSVKELHEKIDNLESGRAVVVERLDKQQDLTELIPNLLTSVSQARSIIQATSVQQSSHAEALSRTDQEQKEIRKEIAMVKAIMHSRSDTSNRMEREFTTLSLKVQQDSKHLTSFQGNVDKLQNKISGIENSVKGLSNQYNSLNSEHLIKNLVAVLDPFSATVHKRIQEYEGKRVNDNNNYQSRFEKITADVIAVRDSFKELEAATAELQRHSKTIEASQQSTSDLKKTLVDTIQRNDERDSQITAIQEIFTKAIMLDIESLKSAQATSSKDILAKIDPLVATIRQLETETEQLRVITTNQAASVTAFAEEDEARDMRISKVQDDIMSINSKVEALLPDQNPVQVAATKVDSRLNSSKEQTAALESTLANHTSAIQKLESEQVLLYEALEATKENLDVDQVECKAHKALKSAMDGVQARIQSEDALITKSFQTIDDKIEKLNREQQNERRKALDELRVEIDKASKKTTDTPNHDMQALKKKMQRDFDTIVKPFRTSLADLEKGVHMEKIERTKAIHRLDENISALIANVSEAKQDIRSEIENLRSDQMLDNLGFHDKNARAEHLPDLSQSRSQKLMLRMNTIQHPEVIDLEGDTIIVNTSDRKRKRASSQSNLQEQDRPESVTPKGENRQPGSTHSKIQLMSLEARDSTKKKRLSSTNTPAETASSKDSGEYISDAQLSAKEKSRSKK